MSDSRQDPAENGDAPDVGFMLGSVAAPAAPPSDGGDEAVAQTREMSAAPTDSDPPGGSVEHAVEPQSAAERTIEEPASEPPATEGRAAESVTVEGQAAEPIAVKGRAAELVGVEGQATEPQTVEGRAAESVTVEERAAEPQTLEEQEAELVQRIARELGAAGPEGWRWLEAVFSLTVADSVAYVHFFDDSDEKFEAEPSMEAYELVRAHRELSAQFGDGPWWRLTVEHENTGEVGVDYDYGDEPFPEGQLLSPQGYRADLETFPREWVPVWLAAYVFHDGRQWRTPLAAAARARADREAGITAELSREDFPPLPLLWARWATIAAAFVAVGSELGPRIRPALGIFEGSARSGATLFVLPGGRAVLSGGLWNAPELEAAYNEGDELPDLYAGAPDWVTNQVLNPRAAQGMLSFCYWWSDGAWRRGESPGADRFSAAVPGVWTAQIVADVVCGVTGGAPSEKQRRAAAALVAAAEAGVVTRDALTALFDSPGHDIDAAMYQLSLAGLVVTDTEPLPRDRAITMVREYILGLGVDTSGYPLDKLVAERLEVGWMVFVPTEPGEIAIGRAIFYIADDGVIEQSSSSTAPSVYIEEFGQRFRRRTGTTAEIVI